MECLQYSCIAADIGISLNLVLNLVINGMPSILNTVDHGISVPEGFKPCYKWNAFNT